MTEDMERPADGTPPEVVEMLAQVQRMEAGTQARIEGLRAQRVVLDPTTFMHVRIAQLADRVLGPLVGPAATVERATYELDVQATIAQLLDNTEARIEAEIRRAQLLAGNGHQQLPGHGLIVPN